MKHLCLIIIGTFSTALAHAQNWTGAVSSDWNNPANWTGAPASGSTLLIDPANYTGGMHDPHISSGSSFSPAQVNLQNGAGLTISANLASQGLVASGEGTAVILETGGALALNGSGANGWLILNQGALFEMSGGDLAVSTRLLFDLGGTGELTGGTITAASIALMDGNTSGSSYLLQDGASITVDEQVIFENQAGNYFPTYNKLSGSLQVTGGMQWLGMAPGSGRGRFWLQGGATNVSGTIINYGSSTMGMSLRVSGDGHFQNSATVVQLAAGDSIYTDDGARWSDLGMTVWKNDGVIYSDYGDFSAGTLTTFTGTGLYQLCHLRILTGRKLDHVSPQNLYVNESIFAKGVFDHHENKLILNGDYPQIITANFTGITFYDLEINNSYESNSDDDDDNVILNQDLTITHNLTLIDGVVHYHPVTTVKILEGATITGGCDTTFLQGYVEKTGNTPFVFPIGKKDWGPGGTESVARRYRPLAISAPASAATVVRAGYLYEAYEPGDPVAAPLENASQVEYWDLSRTGSNDLFTVTVGWDRAAESGLTDCAFTSMALHTAAGWVNVPSTITGLCEDANAGSLASNSILPEIGPVTIGFLERVYQNLVTVCPLGSVTVNNNTYTESGVYIDEMLDHNGNDSTVITVLTVLNLFYATIHDNGTFFLASAVRADHFQWLNCLTNEIVQDGPSFSFTPQVTGTYAVIASRYGCEDVDTSDCLFMEVEGSYAGINEASVSETILYPNPVAAGGALHLKTELVFDEVEIHTAEGRSVAVLSELAHSNGVSSLTLPQLASGTYLLTGRLGGGQVFIQRFVVKE